MPVGTILAAVSPVNEIQSLSWGDSRNHPPGLLCVVLAAYRVKGGSTRLMVLSLTVRRPGASIPFGGRPVVRALPSFFHLTSN